MKQIFDEKSANTVWIERSYETTDLNREISRILRDHNFERKRAKYKKYFPTPSDEYLEGNIF